MDLLNKKWYISEVIFDFLDKKVRENKNNSEKYLTVIADLIRYNILLSVSRAGTGHLGASLSIIEILTEVYFRSFRLTPKFLKDKNRDIFVLSKGHAVPALYSVLAAKGYFPTDDLNRLRRLHGLPGHCDRETAGIEANTGSLAMGLSKAVGHAILKKRMGLKGNVVVTAGDGELQEGQCWEAFLSAVSFRCDNLYIVIDDNKVQTDRFTQEIVRYGNLINTFKSLGFYVFEENGKDIHKINRVFQKAKELKGKPKLLYFHTIKGQGISYMEHPNVYKNKDDRYVWHNKAPNENELKDALTEIHKRNEKNLIKLGFDWDISLSLINIPIIPIQVNITGDNLIAGFKEGLAHLAKKYKKIVVLDGDLEEDCGFTPFHKLYPKRFFEMGIMEQHIVSSASAFSRLGYIPVVSSYAAFLTSRSNEQLYNLASEGAKAIIVGNMSGMIPATPGKSHQAFRDISCMKNIPGVKMYQPITSGDVKNVLTRYFKGDFGNLLYIRLSMAASAAILPTPPFELKNGQSHIISKGKDAVIIGIGPVVLGESLKAAEDLSKENIDIEVWNHPWITSFDKNQLTEISERKIPVIIIEDHFIRGGFGESIFSYCIKENIHFTKILHIALKDFPQTGFREEALNHFGLDKKSIVNAVKTLLL